jgi:hypothetical protein
VSLAGLRGQRPARQKKKRPGCHQRWHSGPSRLCDLPIGCAALGAPLWDPSTSALLVRGRDVSPSGRFHVTRSDTTVRCSQRTSLRLLSRVRATTFMHFVLPPPVMPAPAGPVDKPPPRADVSFGGPGCGSGT